MIEATNLTGRLIAAGRALSGISHEVLARAAGIDPERMSLAEASGSATIEPIAEAQAILLALEQFGVVFVGESDGMGEGVRLKFTRDDALQIESLEGEGGPARNDDAL
jgi:hypothetical protein